MSRPTLRLQKPWLILDLGEDSRIMGWPVVGPAAGNAHKIAWLQVIDADLPSDVNPAKLWRRRAKADGVDAKIGLMTAADIGGFSYKSLQTEEDGLFFALATAGLGNAESVFPPRMENDAPPPAVGTVNLVLGLPRPLSQAAALEALSIAAEARTAAIAKLDLSLPDGRPVTGTGTDCILLVWPRSGPKERYAGLHTRLGRALAHVCVAAMDEAARNWLATSPAAGSAIAEKSRQNAGILS